MTRIVQARFDGEAIGVPLEEEVDPSPPRSGEPYSFLMYAASLRLEGPEDWSENLDEYLYRGKKLPGNRQIGFKDV